MKELKAEDLRIGNLVEFNDLHCFVSGIKADGMLRLRVTHDYKFNPNSNNGEIHADVDVRFVNPVRLTEKWLEMFAFTKDKTFVDETHTFYDWIKYDFRISMPYFALDNIDYEVEFEFVHHLQNTFKDLKGQELTIKNETNEKRN